MLLIYWRCFIKMLLNLLPNVLNLKYSQWELDITWRYKGKDFVCMRASVSHGEVIRYQCCCRSAGSFLFFLDMCLGITTWQYASSKTRWQPTTNAKVVTPAIPDAPGSRMYRCLADGEAVLTECTKLWRCLTSTAAANNASPSAT